MDSLLETYDELMRSVDNLLGFDCESEFLRFVINQEECRQKWLCSVKECERLTRELERAHHDIKEREIKLHHARRLLDQESKQRRKAETAKEAIETQLVQVRELLFSNPINDETREKLAFLSNTTIGRPSATAVDPRLNTISEALDSTGSIISDLGYSRSEDDLDESMTRGRWKNVRHSSSPNSGGDHVHQSKRRKSENMNQDQENNKQVIMKGKGMLATTSMSVTATGTITAHSRIEALPSPAKKPKSPSIYDPPSAPSKTPPPVKTESSDDSLCRNIEAETSPNVCGYVFGINNKKMMMRGHDFVTKTVLRPETCNPCGKRIKFGSVILKCTDCRASAHPGCRNQVPLPCIAVVNTPKAKGFHGVIADYTPLEAPMIPAILIHCINEIERRGLSDIGLYRIPGSDKEVKALKEKFLRGKGIPNLSDVDINVLCSTVKDFLRGLKEPLISSLLKSDFIKAVDGDSETIRSNLYQVISELPQPNRDTLAYLILHLQRMSQNPECKMDVTNLAKVFALTVIGFSSDDLDLETMKEETERQIKIMEQLMLITSEYWNSFLNVEPAPMATFRTPLHPSRSASSVIASPFVTPLLAKRTPRKGKFFATPPSLKK